MEFQELDQHLQAARLRIAELKHTADLDPDNGFALAVAIEELRTSFEELQVADEELRAQNEELARTRLALEEERRRYHDLFELAPVGYLQTTPHGTIIEVNRAVAQLFNSTPCFLRGKPLATLVEEGDRRAFRDRFDRLGREQDLIHDWCLRLRPRHSPPVDAILTAAVERSPGGQVTGMRWILYDATGRRAENEARRLAAAELERRVLERTVQLETANRIQEQILKREIDARDSAESAQRRLKLLASASSLLATALDLQTTLDGVAHLVVPELADICLVDLVDGVGGLRRVSVAHHDPGHQEATNRLRASSASASIDSPYGCAHVIRSGVPELVPEVNEVMRRAADFDPDYRVLLGEIEVSSYLCVPLVARGRTLGAMLLATADAERRYGSDELALAEELGTRAALAIDNAQLYREAQQANKAKMDFLAVMSHELRTPLNAVIGYADLIAMGVPEEVPATGRRQAERIRGASQHLLELIEQILAFSRIQAGRELVELEQVNPTDLVTQVTGLIDPLAAEKGLRLVCKVEGDLPPMRTDPAKVRQILVNLLSNAVKFTERGEVGLAVGAEEGSLVFDVWDTGIGITPNDIGHVFDPFWQVEQGHSRRRGGTGLGLSVARHLVQLLGGDIGLESTPGDGSRFTVSLPVNHPNAVTPAVRTAQPT